MSNPTELSILTCLWQKSSPVGMREISMNIHVEEGEAAGVLAGMASKGMIELWDGGYRPLLTSSQYCTAEIRDLVGQLYGGDTVAFLADYIDAAGPEERAALEDAFHKEGRQS